MNKIAGYLFFTAMFTGCVAAFAQQNGKGQNSKAARKEEHKDNLNKTDAQHRKQGMWFYKHEARLGEPLYYEYGNYLNDQKTGVWTTLDAEQRLQSTENFTRGVLNGTAQYYEQGHLICIGNYRGRYADHKNDSIWVTNPTTYYDTLVALPADIGSAKHGIWRYYDPKSGQMTREEEYQVDNLIYTREFHFVSKTDSIRIEQRNANLPHNRKRYPTGKIKSQTSF